MAKANETGRDGYIRVITFARTFPQKAHAAAFMNGQVRMQTVEHFRGLEDSHNALRGDAYEGLSAIWQPSRLTHIMVGPHKILPSELAGPLQVHDVAIASWHVFCMHTIGITPEDPDNLETMEDFKRALRLDERCADFGDHVVVIVDPDKFLSRVLAAIRARGFNYRTGPVGYFSELEYSGAFPEKKVPFRKPKRFSYQKEYRIVAKTPPGVTSPLILDIGDISDIATMTTFGEFNDSLQIELPDGTRI